MPYSKVSVLIIEDDSRVSRVLRNHLEEAFPQVRVEIAGSAAKAKTICEKFPPTFIVWDGAPNERGTQDEYVNCIPAALWNRVIPISVDAQLLELAKSKGALAPIPKSSEAVNSWSDKIAKHVAQLLPKKKK